MKRWISYLLLVVSLASAVGFIWGLTIWDENGLATSGLILSLSGGILAVVCTAILVSKDQHVFGILCVIVFFVVTIGLIVGGVMILVNCLIAKDAGLALLGIILLQLGLLLSFGPWVNFFISLAELIAAIVFLFIFFITFTFNSFLWTIIFGLPGFIGCAISSAKLTPSASYTPIGKQEKEASVVKRSIVGYVIGGPVGAMVGALSAVDKNNRMRSK